MNPQDPLQSDAVLAVSILVPGIVALVAILSFRSWRWRSRLREIARWRRL